MVESSNVYENCSLKIEEFVPTSRDDPMFENLRRCFVESFEEFYVEHLNELQIDSIENLRQWLNKSFDDEEKSLIDGIHRCFLSSKENLRVFCIFRHDDEENLSILRFVVRRDLKRQKIGSKFLDEFLQMFSSSTNFYFKFRRINEPAKSFFLKHGATILHEPDSIYLSMCFVSTLSFVVLGFFFNEKKLRFVFDFSENERQRRFSHEENENSSRPDFRCCSLS